MKTTLVPLSNRAQALGGRELLDRSRPNRPTDDVRTSETRLNRDVVGQRSGVTTVALLTGGEDRPYALGIAAALTSGGIHLDFIGSDDLSSPELLHNPRINFLNLRGDQQPGANVVKKVFRIILYYIRLIRYATTAQPEIFHVLWNNRFQFFDRTLLMRYYKWLGKKIVLTAHNVNARKRDRNDSFLNRLSLTIQYRLSDHILVHTERMKQELMSDFGAAESKISVIPFGINNTVPNTTLTTAEARRVLDIDSSDRTLLFFGQIAPYKGLESLIAAFTEISKKDGNYRLIIAGKPQEGQSYWSQVERSIAQSRLRTRIIERIEYIPDDETELYFKATDVVVLPYARIFQSGVLFLAYAFGLPVIAADVGSLRDEVIEGETGFVFSSGDALDLARKIDIYFKSELFHDLENRRAQIKQYANKRYSWDKVATIIKSVYSQLLNI